MIIHDVLNTMTNQHNTIIFIRQKTDMQNTQQLHNQSQDAQASGRAPRLRPSHSIAKPILCVALRVLPLPGHSDVEPEHARRLATQWLASTTPPNRFASSAWPHWRTMARGWCWARASTMPRCGGNRSVRRNAHLAASRISKNASST